MSPPVVDAHAVDRERPGMGLTLKREEGLVFGLQRAELVAAVNAVALAGSVDRGRGRGRRVGRQAGEGGRRGRRRR